MGLSESDIIDVVRMVEDWLRSRETRRFLHSFLFDFYRDYKPLLELGSRKNNVVEHLKRPQLKAIEAIDREAEPTTHDVHIKAKFEEVNQMIDEECESLKAVMVKEADAKRLIPDLIDVRTIQQKAVIALAYYYHYRDPDNFSADSEARKNLVREWPKSKVPDTSPDAEEIPVPTPIGFQFFVEECSQVPNISPKGHQRVESWATEVAEACKKADGCAGPDAPSSTDGTTLGQPELEGNLFRWGDEEHPLTNNQTKVMRIYIKEYKHDSEALLKGKEVLDRPALEISIERLIMVFDGNLVWKFFDQPKKGFYRLKWPTNKT